MNVENYTRLLCKRGEENIFILPWSTILLRNISTNGCLLKYKSMKQFKRKRNKLWVKCSLQIFRNVNNQTFFPMFTCEVCRFTQSLKGFSLNQNPATLQRFKCIHTQACDRIVDQHGGFRNMWPIDTNTILPQDEHFTVKIARDTEAVTLQENHLFLAAVFNKKKDKISILTTLNRGMKIPMCQTCSTKPCGCFRKYKDFIETQNLQNNVQTQWYWDQRKTRQRTYQEPIEHYNEDIANKLQHGYNMRKTILYPIKRNVALQAQFQAQVAGTLPYPQGELKPAYDPAELCPHQNSYDPSDDNLVLLKDNAIIFSEHTEEFIPIQIYGRKAVGACKCLQQSDTSDMLLWNIGSGVLIKYTWLHSAVHRYLSGELVNAQYDARLRSFNSLGLPTNLQEHHFRKALFGK